MPKTHDRLNDPTPLWKWLELRIKNRREGKLPLPLPPKPNTLTNPYTKTLYTHPSTSDTPTNASAGTGTGGWVSSDVLHSLSSDAEVGLLKLREYISILRHKLQAAGSTVSRPNTPLRSLAGGTGSANTQATSNTATGTRSKTPSTAPSLTGVNVGGLHSHNSTEHPPVYGRSPNAYALGGWSESLENLHASPSPSKAHMSIKLASIPGLALRTANLKNRVTSAMPAHRPHEHTQSHAHVHAHARDVDHPPARGDGDGDGPGRDGGHSSQCKDATNAVDNVQTGFSTQTNTATTEQITGQKRDMAGSDVSLDSLPPVLHDMHLNTLAAPPPTATDHPVGDSKNSLVDLVGMPSSEGTHSAVLGGAVDAHVITDSLDQDFFTPGGGSTLNSKNSTESAKNRTGERTGSGTGRTDTAADERTASEGGINRKEANPHTHTRTRKGARTRAKNADKGKGKHKQTLCEAPVSPLVHAKEASVDTHVHSAYADTPRHTDDTAHTSRASQRYSSEGRLSRSERAHRYSSGASADSRSDLSDLSDSESDFGPDIPGDDPTLMDTEGEIVLEIDINQHARTLANESGLGASTIDGEQIAGAHAELARERFGTGADSCDIYPISSNTNTHTYGLTRPTSHAIAQPHVRASTRAYTHAHTGKHTHPTASKHAHTQAVAEKDRRRGSADGTTDRDSSRTGERASGGDSRRVSGVKEGLRRVVECPVRLPVQPSADLARFIRKRQLRVFPSMVDHDGRLGLLAEQSTRLSETEVDAVRAVRPNMPTPNTNRSSWKPRGTLIAHLFEHKGPVNRLAVAEDNMFFASASDDGTVKIWDAARLVKAFACKSSQTYRPPPPREGLMGVRHIRSLAMCESSRSIACVSVSPDSGASSIHVFKVGLESAAERTGQGSEATHSKYAHPETMYSVDIDEFDEGAVTEVAHVYANGCSLLVYITVRGCVYAVDLRTNQTVWKIRLDPSVGLVTAFLIDQTRCWMVVGTSKGALVVCDIRFRVAVTTWLHPGGYPVTRIIRADYLPDTQLFIACGPWVTVWDIETRKCLRLLRVTDFAGNASEPIPDMKPVPFVSEYNSQSNTGHSVRQSPSTDSYDRHGRDQYHTMQQHTPTHTHAHAHASPYPETCVPTSVYTAPTHTPHPAAAFSGVNMCDSPRTVRALVCPPETPYILTASMDSTIRLWNLSNPTLSFHISSPSINESERHAHPDSVPVGGGHCARSSVG
ncbi:hypothetical protein SARC_01401 [Sphaeroforma arctica JP610]|uniref:Uncharacterized protein n=1 Tax=Sphaeroforma arctica JP610 TaxID=667725 RepID=A0A0L0GBS1_9EUKA|nr:hypothetical protein SARC_01401 [Sphaeroforma arctica JP610]KNC86445.1 hypothetical protein SARC_01401 [Sphaeroforma arctica JP610]|eukprot:XP_014160347.1 hypothetical protein SARC_01401 [Sphaeroforma arctica JP610]